jgi:mannose-6-phosphate isomerase-like protein (cupin superfamily)
MKRCAMELLARGDFKLLSNPGVESMQLLSPHNSKSARVTITSVTVAPGAAQPRHRHETSEQTWVAIEGSGMLLLGDDRTEHFEKGQVARFDAGDVHGFDNTGDVPFTYISVTAPPIDFSYAYERGA